MAVGLSDFGFPKMKVVEWGVVVNDASMNAPATDEDMK